MRIAWATVGDAATVHAVQTRYLLYDAQAAKIVKAESLAEVRRSLSVRVCLIAEHRGVPIGAIRAQVRKRHVYVDALWVPDFAGRLPLCVLLLLQLEERIVPKRTMQIRAVHGDPRCFEAYGRSGYDAVYEETLGGGLSLRFFEKKARPDGALPDGAYPL